MIPVPAPSCRELRHSFFTDFSKAAFQKESRNLTAACELVFDLVVTCGQQALDLLFICPQSFYFQYAGNEMLKEISERKKSFCVSPQTMT